MLCAEGKELDADACSLRGEWKRLQPSWMQVITSLSLPLPLCLLLHRLQLTFMNCFLGAEGEGLTVCTEVPGYSETIKS